MNSIDFRSLAILALYFSFLGIVFYFSKLGSLIWIILAASAIVWFLLECFWNAWEKERIKKGVLLGIFLLVLDFIVQNAGALLGYWNSYKSIFSVGATPIEIMLVCLFGGAAWYLYLPKKFVPAHSAVDALLFSSYATLGEFILGKEGLLIYSGGWTSLHAFLAYAITWAVLNFVRYKIIR